MKTNAPITLEELRKIKRPAVNANVKLKESLTPIERGAVWVTDHVGTIEFFIVCNILVAMTLIFPATVTTIQFVSSAWLQLVLLPLIMVGQNIQGRHSEARAEADFEVNKKAEMEIETILQHLENQNEMMLQILNRLDKK